ncbi:MAG: hypothetical protein KJZ98_03005 [Burkholderiaceae bacterium]|jgi:hypothetical protein|nr:hypothetical protein [Burkholderiaceae bacterium]MEB2351484.1 hypothetical protein [Burkholderiaceae bacterium]
MQGKVRNRAAVAVAVSLAVALLAGCAGLPPVETRRLDAHFGDAVRQARAQQTLNPEASRNTDPVAGIDGVAAQNTIEQYQKGFKEPPPTFNILGIGGTSVSP